MEATPGQKFNIKTILQTAIARQVLFIIGLAFSVALGINLYRLTSEPIYKPLDYQLTQKNMASIVDTLEKSRINYKINERDGMILVNAKDIELARLKLSAAGIPKDDSFNYSFLNDQGALSNSQFLESVRYLRALENDLAKTISGIEGVSGARVHIAIPKNNVFADENNKVTASVFLNISPTFMANKEKVHSIIQIVADSIPGLDPKDVAITDQYGHYLSQDKDPNSVYNAEQLTYQNNLQNYYEKRIESMIVPLLGENKVVVRVNADINYTQQELAQEEYDPNKAVLLSEQSSIEQSESAAGASGPPGALSNTPPEDGKNNQSPQSSTGGGSKRTQSTKNYNVSKSVVYKKTNVAQIKNLSVAVVVDNEVAIDPATKKEITKPLDKEKIDKITELVKTVIGYDEKRGDKVTVINSVYSQMKQEIPDTRLSFWENPWFWDVMKKMISIILGFALLFFMYRKSFGWFKNQPQPKSKTKSKSQFVPEDDKESDPEEQENSINRMHAAKNDGMDKLKQLALNEPNKVAMIIKGWVRK